jgi:hypothetical protein
MKIWYDTEFIEDGKTIDLISIGMVAEDGRQYYAQLIEADHDKASPWVKENVIEKLLPCPNSHNGASGKFWHDHSCNHLDCPWRSRHEVKRELLNFVGRDKPEFWAYYADYDHVALCQLFGTMMSLPTGWPKYTRDVKQLCDSLGNPKLPEQDQGEHHALADAIWTKQAYEFLLEVGRNTQK